MVAAGLHRMRGNGIEVAAGLVQWACSTDPGRTEWAPGVKARPKVLAGLTVPTLRVVRRRMAGPGRASLARRPKGRQAAVVMAGVRAVPLRRARQTGLMGEMARRLRTAPGRARWAGWAAARRA